MSDSALTDSEIEQLVTDVQTVDAFIQLATTPIEP
jgi:hypothetical protein